MAKCLLYVIIPSFPVSLLGYFCENALHMLVGTGRHEVICRLRF